MPCWSVEDWRNITAQHDTAKRRVAHHYTPWRSSAEHCNWWRCPVSGTEYSFQSFSHLNTHFNWMLGIFWYSPVLETMHPTWKKRQNVKHGTIHGLCRTSPHLAKLGVCRKNMHLFFENLGSKQALMWFCWPWKPQARPMLGELQLRFVFLHIPSLKLIFLWLCTLTLNNLENFGILAINYTYYSYKYFEFPKGFLTHIDWGRKRSHNPNQREKNYIPIIPQTHLCVVHGARKKYVAASKQQTAVWGWKSRVLSFVHRDSLV